MNIPESVAKIRMVEQAMALYGRGTQDPIQTRKKLMGLTLEQLAIVLDTPTNL